MVLSSQWTSAKNELAGLRRSLQGREGIIDKALILKYSGDIAGWIRDFGLFRSREGIIIELDSRQTEFLRSKERKIVLNCHRQFGKSTLASLKCFHRALFFPRSLCLLFAPSIRQSRENLLRIQDSLGWMEPRPELSEDTKLTLTFPNGSRIISLPGSEKTTRGFSAPDIIMVDEASRANDELFAAVAPMLVSNPKSQIVLASTPWGSRGFFHAVWTEGGSSWKQFLVTVEGSSWLDKEFLETERHSHPDAWYRQEFLCEFLDTAGQVFNSDLVDSLFSDQIEPLFPQNVNHNNKNAAISKTGVPTLPNRSSESESLINPNLKTLDEEMAEAEEGNYGN